MKQFCLIISLALFTHSGFALPFTITPKTTLPTSVNLGYSNTAYYTVTNNTSSARNNNYVKYIPGGNAITTQITSGGTYQDTCGATFNLAAKGQSGDSCTLQLSIINAINGADPDPAKHLFVCFPGGTTCAGTNEPLNVAAIANPALDPFKAWLAQLPSGGYLANQGNAYLMVNSDCALYISIFGSCFDQNPAAPYIIPQPPIEQSYVDPYYAVPLNQAGPDGTTNIIYRLSDQDALVTIVSYPPKAAYLGYQSYVFSSETSNYTTVYPLQIPSPDPSRFELFASIGNDVNNVIVQNQLGSSPWNGTVAMYITTSNQTLATALTENAINQGISANAIFIEPMGSNILTGNNSTSDDFVTLIRYAVPESTSSANNWNANLSTNVLVYKVTDATASVSRYGANAYTARDGTTNETALQGPLNQVATLLQAYLTSKQGTPSTITPSTASSSDDAQHVPTYGFVGNTCIGKGTICNGDNQDTSTYAMARIDTLAASETAFIVGVNHNALNNASYISDDISNAATSAGVASSSQTNESAVGFDSGILTGSAEAVLTALGISIPDGLAQALPYLYVTFIARDCSNPTINAASAYCINLLGDSLVPAADPISFTERSYIRPTTTTGGNVNIMIYPSLVAATSDFTPSSTSFLTRFKKSYHIG